MLVQRTARSYGGLDISYETEFYVETKLRILGSSFARVLCVMPPKPFFRPGKQSQSMALCPVPSARGDDRGRPCGSAVDLAALVDSGGYVRVPLRRRGNLVVLLLFCSVFVRIGAARCVYFVSDGGCHGASAMGLMAQGDSVGYVRVPCRL